MPHVRSARPAPSRKAVTAHNAATLSGSPPAPNPMAGTVAQAMLLRLKAEGVRHVFGIPGGAAVWLMNALRHDPDMRYIICRHESGAAYIADGLARVSGGLGVVLTTSGPGATNALTGAMNAQASGVPMLVLTGEVPEKYFGRGYLQEGADAQLDVQNVFQNAVGYSALISSPDNAGTLLQRALTEVLTVPCQAAHLSLPNDIGGMCVPPGSRAFEPAARPTVRSTDEAGVQQALDALLSARRPLILLGNGARRALSDPARRQAFVAWVDRFGVPVMTTPDAKGIFPEGQFWSLRNYGICACNWPAHYMHPSEGEPFDALLVLGSALGELATSVQTRELYSPALAPSRHFIQVDLQPGMIGRNFAVTQGIVAEVGATLDAMLRLSARRKPRVRERDARAALIQTIRDTVSPWQSAADRTRRAAPTQPAAMMHIVNELMPRGHIFIDAGNCVGWALHHLVIDEGLHCHAALDMGPMGFGVCAVIGGKMAAPDEPCLAIVGDGAFMMHGAEVSTAAAHGVGAVWVVLDDNDLAMVSQGMAQLLPPASQWADTYALGRPDLAAFASSLGAEAVTVRHDQGVPAFRTALRGALQRARQQSRPQVVVVQIDRRAAPPYGWPTLTPPACSPEAR